MKKLLVVALAFLTSIAQAQDTSKPVIRNDSASTDLYTANMANGSAVAVDAKGRQFVTSATGASDMAKAEDAPHTSGDVGNFCLAVRNGNNATLTNTDLDYSPIAVAADGAVFVKQQLGYANDGVAGAPLLHEDTPSADGDMLHGMGCRRNDSATTGFTNTDGDYSIAACTSTGALQTAIIGQALGKSLARLEDDVWTSGDTMAVVGGQNESAMTVAQSAANDVSNIKLDLTGRLMVGPAPHGEFWQACGTATASTSDVAIKAAVASNRIYVTSITCASSDADNATNLNFKDNTTVIAVGGVNQMATTSAGTFFASFPTPLRGTSNTAFNFNTAVATSSVICCGAGFISVD